MGHGHLMSELKAVEAKGGEGLMLRQPRSLYDTGGSTRQPRVVTPHGGVTIGCAGSGMFPRKSPVMIRRPPRLLLLLLFLFLVLLLLLLLSGVITNNTNTRPHTRAPGRRSSSLLKVKSQHDEEAQVVSHEGGKGRNAYRCGALTLRTPDGREFSCGSGMTDADRAKPPPIGSIVTCVLKTNALVFILSF